MKETERIPRLTSLATAIIHDLHRYRACSRTRINYISLLLLSALFVCGSLPAARAQVAYLPGGLLIHPTAYTPPRNQFSLYAAGFTQQENGFTPSFYPISLSYSPTSRLEVSALLAYHQAANLPTHTHMGTFLKYQLVPDAPNHPAFALTTSYVANDHAENTITGVASHNLVHRGRVVTTLHLGAKWLKTPDFSGGQNDFGGFIGAEVPLTRQWTLVGETSTRLRFESTAASGLGLMYHARRSPNLTFGFVNDGRSSSLRFFFGVGYPFGG